MVYIHLEIWTPFQFIFSRVIIPNQEYMIQHAWHSYLSPFNINKKVRNGKLTIAM